MRQKKLCVKKRPNLFRLNILVIWNLLGLCIINRRRRRSLSSSAVYQKASRMRDESEEGMKKVLDLPGRAQVVYITNKYIRGSFSWGNRSIVRCYTRKMLDYTEARETGDWSLCVVVLESLASQPGQKHHSRFLDGSHPQRSL